MSRKFPCGSWFIGFFSLLKVACMGDSADKRWLIFLILSGITATASAEPWIDTSDIALRTEIQYLADRGVIKAPVTTWPLMWAAIEPDLHAADVSQLDAAGLNAWQDVMRHLDFSKRSISSASVTVANDDNRFAGFGDEYRDKNTVALSSNARPMLALALTRKDASPFRLPFTDDYQIPWTVTTFMGHMSTDRAVPNALLWGFRLNFKPHPRLEVGVTRLAQWAGDGRPHGFDTFWNVLTGRDNCGNSGLDCTDNSEPGNQQAGYDLRLSVPVAGHNFGIYYQSFAEDGSQSSTKFWTKARPQVGVDTTVTIMDTPLLMFLEYTDSLNYCGNGEQLGIADCYYEHHIYRTGMRYQGRNIGNLYDNDAATVVFGMIAQMRNDASWQWSLRYAHLNRDNSDAYPGEPDGNTVTEIAEDLLMLSGKYQRIFGRWKIGAGGSASHSTFRDQPGDDDYRAFLDLEYLL